MNRLAYISFGILCCTIAYGEFLKSMSKELKETEVTGIELESLPPELKLYIAQYLGGPTDEMYPEKSINPMIKDLLVLSEVNKQFKNFLKSEPDTIAHIIKQKFGQDAIMKAIYDQLVFGGDLDGIVRFIKVGLFTANDLAQFNEEYPFAWMANIFRKWGNAHKYSVDEEEKERMYRALEFLLNEKFIDSNYKRPQHEKEQELEGVEAKSWLYDAVSSNDHRLWDLLVNNGADLHNPKNARAVALAKDKGWL
jgi:hypothetical protein